MAIKISKLWQETTFNRYSKNAKLLYLYLLTNPQINILGVVEQDVQVVCKETSISYNEMRVAAKELVDTKKLVVEKSVDSFFFVLLGFYKSNTTKSESTLIKVKEVLDTYPQSFITKLDDIGIKLNVVVNKFVVPTPKEVSEYALGLGYSVDGKTFVDYYNNSSVNRLDGKWQDGRGKLITDWKAKVRKVWCKDSNKLVVLEGCPKGMENFSIDFLDKTYYPDSWVDGLPSHVDFGIKKMLQKKFKSM